MVCPGRGAFEARVMFGRTALYDPSYDPSCSPPAHLCLLRLRFRAPVARGDASASAANASLGPIVDALANPRTAQKHREHAETSLMVHLGEMSDKRLASSKYTLQPLNGVVENLKNAMLRKFLRDLFESQVVSYQTFVLSFPCSVVSSLKRFPALSRSTT